MGRFSPTVLPVYPVADRGGGLDRFAEAISGAAVRGYEQYHVSKERKRRQEREDEDAARARAMDAYGGIERHPGGQMPASPVQMPGRPAGPGQPERRASESIVFPGETQTPESAGRIALGDDYFLNPDSPKAQAERAARDREANDFAGAIRGVVPGMSERQAGFHGRYDQAGGAAVAGEAFEDERDATSQASWREAVLAHPELGEHYRGAPEDPRMDWRKIYEEGTGVVLRGNMAAETAGARADAIPRAEIGPTGLTMFQALEQARKELAYTVTGRGTKENPPGTYQGSPAEINARAEEIYSGVPRPTAPTPATPPGSQFNSSGGSVTLPSGWGVEGRAGVPVEDVEEAIAPPGAPAAPGAGDDIQQASELIRGMTDAQARALLAEDFSPQEIEEILRRR